MTIVEIKSPVFRVVVDKNVHAIERHAMTACKEGWYPVGGIGRKGNDWVQVMVKEEKVYDGC